MTGKNASRPEGATHKHSLTGVWVRARSVHGETTVDQVYRDGRWVRPQFEDLPVLFTGELKEIEQR